VHSRALIPADSLSRVGAAWLPQKATNQLSWSPFFTRVLRLADQLHVFPHYQALYLHLPLSTFLAVIFEQKLRQEFCLPELQPTYEEGTPLPAYSFSRALGYRRYQVLTVVALLEKDGPFGACSAKPWSTPPPREPPLLS
jgi:hypothetical protein